MIVTLMVAAFVAPTLATAATTPDSPYTLQSPDVIWTEETWIWMLQIQYAWALFSGFLAGLLCVTWITWRLTGAKTRKLGELIAGVARNPFVWLITGFAAVLSGLIYSGAFEFIRNQTWDKLSGLYSWAPLGVLPIVLAWIGKRLAGRLAIVRDALTGDRGALTTLLASEKTSMWVSILVLDDYHDAQQKRISAIAENVKLGLIQRVVWETLDTAVDKGKLSATYRDERTKALLEVQPGTNERSRFRCTRQGVQAALPAMPLDELEARLRDGERRVTVDMHPDGGGRPEGVDRRKGLAWQPEAKERVAA